MTRDRLKDVLIGVTTAVLAAFIVISMCLALFYPFMYHLITHWAVHGLALAGYCMWVGFLASLCWSYVYED